MTPTSPNRDRLKATRGVDPELLQDLRDCNRAGTADLLEELYEALLNTLAVAKLKWGNLDEDVNVVFKQAESAIAKARGEQP